MTPNKPIDITFIGLNELSDSLIHIPFHKYSTTPNDIIDAINFANGAKAHNHSEIDTKLHRLGK